MLKGVEDMYLYETTEGKNIVVVCYAPSKDLAIKEANKYFKSSVNHLDARKGFVDEHGLWWEDENDSRIPCYAVWRKS